MELNTAVPDLPRPPSRVVSLVPSVTESIFTLGLGERLVGLTDYCVHPAEQTAALPKVGGTKNAEPERILALQPDLVIANQEENASETVQSLQASGVPVWLTFPKSVQDAVLLLYDLAGLFRSPNALLAVKSLSTAVDYARAAMPVQRIRYFCPIWFDRLADGTPWWMTFNHATYPHDLLSLLGGENVFSQRMRRYPLAADLDLAPAKQADDRDVRYPRVGAEEIRAAEPELILLPSEPYAFSDADLAPLREIVGKGVRIASLDGSLLTWHGTRLARALRLNLSML